MELTPKGKAEELYDSFTKHAKYWDCYNDMPLEINHTKQCALIAVDEIIYEHNLHLTQFGHECILFWQEVKQELEKL